jgi:hypothetical protein
VADTSSNRQTDGRAGGRGLHIRPAILFGKERVDIGSEELERSPETNGQKCGTCMGSHRQRWDDRTAGALKELEDLNFHYIDDDHHHDDDKYFFLYSIFTVHFSSIDNVFHQLNALVIKTLKYSKTD